MVGKSRSEIADKQKEMPGIVRSPDPFTGPGTYSIYFVSLGQGKRPHLYLNLQPCFSSIENQAEKQELKRTAHYFN